MRTFACAISPLPHITNKVLLLYRCSNHATIWPSELHDFIFTGKSYHFIRNSNVCYARRVKDVKQPNAFIYIYGRCREASFFWEWGTRYCNPKWSDHDAGWRTRWLYYSQFTVKCITILTIHIIINWWGFFCLPFSGTKGNEMFENSMCYKKEHFTAWKDSILSTKSIADCNSVKTLSFSQRIVIVVQSVLSILISSCDCWICHWSFRLFERIEMGGKLINGSWPHKRRIMQSLRIERTQSFIL